MLFQRVPFKLNSKKSLKKTRKSVCKNRSLLNKAAVFLCLIFLFVCAPTTHAESVKSNRPLANSTYRIVPPHKSLAAAPEFILIDDFSSTDWKNKRGGVWHLRNATAKDVAVSRVKEDARNPKFGYSLKLEFDLPEAREMIWKSSLERVDASQADLLVFSCKFKPKPNRMFSGSLRVVLEDSETNRAIIDITPSCSGGNVWNEVTLRKEHFKNVDWDQLNSLSFVLVSGPNVAMGEMQFDEIAFYGPNDVAFESNLDNLVGFPKTIYSESRRFQLLNMEKDKDLLREIAKDTWQYFENAQNKDNFMIVDHIRLGDSPLASNYTSPTNLAMDLMGLVAAEKMGFISKREAIERTERKLREIEKLRRWKNLYYNFYETTKLSITRGFISSVDNGWLGVSLVVVRQAYGKELYRQASKILNRMDFGEFLDYENNQLSLGFDSEKNTLVRTHYGMLISEARATSIFGIGKDDLPEDHWWSLYRTPPASWKWQSQEPKGAMQESETGHYFQGYYEYGNMKIVPSWGGSLFEHLMPTLVLDEKDGAKNSFGANNYRAIQAHIDYAINKKEYPIWGLSPAATTNGSTWQYGEYGVKDIGVKGYPDKAVVTPHVTFLALDSAPQDAMINIRNMLKLKMYGEYGFYDSIDVKRNEANPQYLALDQGMSFLAIVNYLEKDILKKLFHKDPIGRKAFDLWEQERFFEE